MLFVVFLLAGAGVLKVSFWLRAPLLVEATWIPDKLLVGEKPGGSSVFLWITPMRTARGEGWGCPWRGPRLTSLSPMGLISPLAPCWPGLTHIPSASAPSPSFRPLRGPRVPTTISFVANMERLEFPLKLAFFPSSQALGMPPHPRYPGQNPSRHLDTHLSLTLLSSCVALMSPSPVSLLSFSKAPTICPPDPRLLSLDD